MALALIALRAVAADTQTPGSDGISWDEMGGQWNTMGTAKKQQFAGNCGQLVASP
jgi:hypothetical protein